jgi:hypothetical protein
MHGHMNVKSGRQKILHRTIASIPWLQSALNFFLNRIFICKRCSPKCELFHPFKGTIAYNHAVILSCVLVSRLNHELRFPSLYFNKIKPAHSTCNFFVRFSQRTLWSNVRLLHVGSVVCKGVVGQVFVRLLVFSLVRTSIHSWPTSYNLSKYQYS